ncbi:MAG: hypothetical protein ABEK50_01985 [bacterium]
MNDSSTQSLLLNFLETVEELLDSYTSLKSRAQKMHQKIQTLEQENDALEQEVRELKDELDRNRLKFSELAGELEVKFDQIKDEASELLPENQE